jgi:cell division protein FtsQ
MSADAYPQEVLSDDEPRYLRRQKPLEIKRRKFGKKAWKAYLRVAAITGVSMVGVTLVYAAGNFLLTSRDMALLHPDQVEINGNHYVSRARVLEIFTPDRGKSVLRIPLNERRSQLESLPWIESATVRRVLPSTIQVEIVERVPIAFLRQGSDMSLIDIHGVILSRPLEGDFHFPVVAGISTALPVEEREKRMQMFAGFLQQIDSARLGASDLVSEVDVADADDLKAILEGLPPLAVRGAKESSPWTDQDGPLLVHFGDKDFESRYQMLLDNIGQWRATAGRIQSIDLRFSREVVVNPQESTGQTKSQATGGTGRHSR